MKQPQSKDPFEAAALGDSKSPSESPVTADLEIPDAGNEQIAAPPTLPVFRSAAASAAGGKGKEEEDEEEEENMEVELTKFPSGDPDKSAKMQ